MKSFKEYTKSNQFGKNAGLSPDGSPMALVDFGHRHKHEQAGIDPTGMPMALVDFGKRKKGLNEKEEHKPDEDWFYSHGENASWGSHPQEQSDELHKSENNENLEHHSRAYANHSADLNKSLLEHALRGRAHPKTHVNDDHSFDIAALDKEVSKNKLTHDLHTYSGVGFHPGKLASEHKDRHITLPAYTSTSISKDIASQFADTAGWSQKLQDETGNGTPKDKHILHFHLKAGQKGKYIGSNSNYPEEHEYLLPRNTKVKIAEHPRMVKRRDKTYHVWDAHPVNPESEAE